MIEAFPPDVRQFVRQEIADGRYQSQEELVAAVVRLLRDSDLRLRQLREELKTRLGQLDQGDCVELDDDEALGAFFDGVEKAT